MKTKSIKLNERELDILLIALKTLRLDIKDSSDSRLDYEDAEKIRNRLLPLYQKLYVS